MVIKTTEAESGPMGHGDLEGVTNPSPPTHNDALDIRATMANYDVAQVFVDADSSINVLFRVALKQMGKNVEDL